MLTTLHVFDSEGKDTLYLCAHWRVFPPTGHHRDGDLSPAEATRVAIWQSMCGLTQMDGAKCLSCQYVRRIKFKQGVAYVVMQDGTTYPLVEKALLEACPSNRGNLVRSIRPAGTQLSDELPSWLKEAKGGDK